MRFIIQPQKDAHPSHWFCILLKRPFIIGYPTVATPSLDFSFVQLSFFCLSICFETLLKCVVAGIPLVAIRISPGFSVWADVTRDWQSLTLMS